MKVIDNAYRVTSYHYSTRRNLTFLLLNYLITALKGHWSPSNEGFLSNLI